MSVILYLVCIVKGKGTIQVLTIASARIQDMVDPFYYNIKHYTRNTVYFINKKEAQSIPLL